MRGLCPDRMRAVRRERPLPSPGVGTAGYVTMKRLNHSMISLFIAGPYTPFCLLLLPVQTRRLLPTVVSGSALAEMVMQTA